MLRIPQARRALSIRLSNPLAIIFFFSANGDGSLVTSQVAPAQV
jgi:hypothetical protein